MEWALHYQQFLYQVFLKNIPNRKNLVDDDSMKIWYKAITHPSYDPLENYRPLQTLGERIEALTYSLILLEEGSNSLDGRISAEERTSVADRLDISTHLRTLFTVGTHTKSAVVSAFIGAFYMVITEKEETNPLDFCKILLKSLFTLSDEPSAIFQIKRIVEGLNWSQSKEFNIEELGKPNAIKQRGEIVGYEVQQKLPEAAMTWIQKKGIIIQDSKLGYSRSIDKEDAIRSATEKTLIILNTLYDITPFTPLEENLSSLSSETRSRLKSDGFKSIRFYRDAEGKRYQLLGIKEDKTEEILLTAIDRGVGSRREAENALIQLYTKEGKKEIGQLLSLSI